MAEAPTVKNSTTLTYILHYPLGGVRFTAFHLEPSAVSSEAIDLLCLYYSISWENKLSQETHDVEYFPKLFWFREWRHLCVNRGHIACLWRDAGNVINTLGYN